MAVAKATDLFIPAQGAPNGSQVPPQSATWREAIDALLYPILYRTVLYYTKLYYTMLHYTMLYTILYYTILYYTILYYTMLYYTILYYTIPYDTKHSLRYYTSGFACSLRPGGLFHGTRAGG